MTNKPLKGIKFPGLDDIYTIPEVYAQNEEPTNASIGALWADLDEELSGPASSDAVLYVEQSLTDEQKAQARQNIRAAKDKPDAAQLLATILQDGVYNSDQSDNLLHLTALLLDKSLYTISTQLENLPTGNWSIQHLEGNSFQTSLLLGKEYVLETVTVTMGGVDITADTVTDGIVNIPAVTGDVVISGAYYKRDLLAVDAVQRGLISFDANNGMRVQGSNGMRAVMLPVGQYLQSGKTYHFSLGSANNTYSYQIKVMQASEPDQEFPYVANNTIYYNTVRASLYESEWVTDDLVYTATQENLVLAVNFKRNVAASISESDCQTLRDVFIPEVLA